MKITEATEERIGTYKWIKIGQSAILIILGILFVITAVINYKNNESVSAMLSISVGVIAAVYGALDILSGYLLNRNPYNQECLIGEMVLSLATVLFIKRDIINEVLSYFVSIFAILFALMLILHGVDLIIGKGIKKSLPKAITAFILAGLLVGAGVTYLIFYINKRETVEVFMLLVLGIVLIILGIASLAVILIKIRNTNKMIKEHQIEEELQSQHQVNSEDHPTNTDVKIIDISDLRKKSKGSSKSEEQNLIVVEEDKESPFPAPTDKK